MVTKWLQVVFKTQFGPAMTLTTNHLTSKPTQLTFFSKMHQSGKLVKFPQAVYKTLCLHTFRLHARTVNLKK